MNGNAKFLFQLGALAGVAAILAAIAGDSSFGAGFTNGAFDWHIRFGFKGNWASLALGLGSMVAVAAGAWFQVTYGDPAGVDNASPLGGFFKGLRELRKSGTDSQIDGVCGGLGEHTPIPAWIWRAAFLITLFCFGTGLGLYFLLAICLPGPLEEEEETDDEDNTPPGSVAPKGPPVVPPGQSSSPGPPPAPPAS
jgi:phage shock protein C